MLTIVILLVVVWVLHSIFATRKASRRTAASVERMEALAAMPEAVKQARFEEVRRRDDFSAMMGRAVLLIIGGVIVLYYVIQSMQP